MKVTAAFACLATLAASASAMEITSSRISKRCGSDWGCDLNLGQDNSWENPCASGTRHCAYLPKAGGQCWGFSQDKSTTPGGTPFYVFEDGTTGTCQLANGGTVYVSFQQGDNEVKVAREGVLAYFSDNKDQQYSIQQAGQSLVSQTPGGTDVYLEYVQQCNVCSSWSWGTYQPPSTWGQLPSGVSSWTIKKYSYSSTSTSSSTGYSGGYKYSSSSSSSGGW